ncbi:MAG: hypothetical protein N2560_05570 [Ignavibacteria bacterium]|nr:hypothetical protein [Ignavibacteria bacterium]
MNNYSPPFPGCSLIVEYCYFVCTQVPARAPCDQCVAYHIKSVSPTYPYCGACNSLFNFLNSGDPYERQIKIRNLITYLTIKIMVTNFQEFVDGLPPHMRRYCEDGCFAKYYVYEGKCQAYCYVHHPVEFPDKKWLITPINCVEQYCCIREYLFCLDRQSGKPRFYTSIYTIPNIVCTNLNIQYSDCPIGEHVEILQCFDNCAH